MPHRDVGFSLIRQATKESIAGILRIGGLVPAKGTGGEIADGHGTQPGRLGTRQSFPALTPEPCFTQTIPIRKRGPALSKNAECGMRQANFRILNSAL